MSAMKDCLIRAAELLGMEPDDLFNRLDAPPPTIEDVGRAFVLAIGEHAGVVTSGDAADNLTQELYDEVVHWIMADHAGDPPPRRLTAATITSDDLTRMHLAVENVLIEYRDARIGMIGPRNGFVIREQDGTPSDIIRLGTRAGLRIALAALLGVKPTELPR